MFYLIGKNNLSLFQCQKYLNKFKSNLLSKIQKLEAKEVFFIDESESFNNKDLEDLVKVLGLNSSYVEPKINHADNNFIVIPRIGTISPWSSKVSDILLHCGIKKVNRVEHGVLYNIKTKNNINISTDDYLEISSILHDKMTESVVTTIEDAYALFSKNKQKKLKHVDIFKEGKLALDIANKTMGLAISNDEIDYLYNSFKKINKNPTDAELFMFSQINSEHCRHKLFNASWNIDNKPQKYSLFQMIKNTSKYKHFGIYTNYDDNGAVIESYDSNNKIVIKVETHNHPTAISPYAGAATGVGGEIRDEAATGIGARSIAGLAGFCVSNLNIPNNIMAWENYEQANKFLPPARISTPLEIMISAPIGAARFSNEFGRPNLNGYFRTLEYKPTEEYNPINSEKNTDFNFAYGYHKPIMIAGGVGLIEESNLNKKSIPHDALLIVLGGPGYLIGLGGGALSSVSSGESCSDLDFASVQRDNAEMQRRAQEVIARCANLQDDNPIISIHDLGAGGLANALSELLHQSNCGGDIALNDIPIGEEGLSPLEILCNESQERFILAINNKNLSLFEKISKRENCPFAVIGTATSDLILNIFDSKITDNSISTPLNLFFDNSPKLDKSLNSINYKANTYDFNHSEIDLSDAITKVLNIPAVASKNFLINIGDRSVGGLVARDQMVGPWQVPVADCSVTHSNFDSYTGQAVAMGERPAIAILNPVASCRMSIGESITNISASTIKNISDIKLSANWMVAGNDNEQSLGLYKSIQDLSENFCKEIGVSIPVGKDSTSMETNWEQGDKKSKVMSPLSCVISAFSPVVDVRQTLTPELNTKLNNTSLLFIDLANGKQRLGGSSLLQAFSGIGSETPNVDKPLQLVNFFNCIQNLNKNNKILSYHDRSDGGLIVTLLEMAFTSRCGLSIDISELGEDHISSLFNEELGAVIQVTESNLEEVCYEFRQHKIPCLNLGTIDKSENIIFNYKNKELYKSNRANLQKIWSNTSYKIQELRDNPETTQQEFDLIADKNYKGLNITNLTNNFPNTKQQDIKPLKFKVAILREQGTNGYAEMQVAFAKAGLVAEDVHMNDLISENKNLENYSGLVACGGFAYGDVLGSGTGWANKILLNPNLKEMFSKFFADKNKFALGVCNGCQMLALLKDIIPGASNWPKFVTNTSEQFESRYCMVKVNKTPSIFFKDMEEALIPIVVAHKEGKVEFSENNLQNVEQESLIAMQYIDSNAKPTENFPQNPNSSTKGITALTNSDGRITIMMPHPERIFRKSQNSWYADNLQDRDYAPWFEMFINAAKWLESK